MKLVLLTVIVVCLHSVAFSAPHPASHPVSIAAVQKLKAPLTMAEVEKAFGASTGQPGPRVTYPCSGHPGMSLWFWLRSNQKAGATYSDAEVGCVILATTIREEQPQVIWPPESIHESPAKLIQQVNATYSPAR